MARGNLLLGKARGKLGSVVFSQNNGAQITRSKPASVRNPKSIGQNTQRAILATIAKAAAAMSSLVDHSFAGVTYGAESVRHFRKINMGILRNLYLNTQNDANLVAKGGTFIPDPLKISEGNLAPFVAIVDNGDVGFVQNSASTLPTSGDITVAQFLQTFPGLQGGDQLTLVKIVKVNNGELIRGDALFTMKLDRIVFAPNAFDNLMATIITEVDGNITPVFLDLTKTTNVDCLTINPATGGLGFSSDGDVYYAALILSRKVNNQWQRSTQYLEQIEFDDHTNNETAIASYGDTASVSAEDEYLNQADEGTGKKGVRGPYGAFYSQIGDTENEISFVNVGSADTQDFYAPANSEILLTCSGYATSDNPITKCQIYKGNTELVIGAPNIEYQFTLTAETAGTYKGVVRLRDGSKAEVTWNVSVQS